MVRTCRPAPTGPKPRHGSVTAPRTDAPAPSATASRNAHRGGRGILQRQIEAAPPASRRLAAADVGPGDTGNFEADQIGIKDLIMAKGRRRCGPSIRASPNAVGHRNVIQGCVQRAKARPPLAPILSRAQPLAGLVEPLVRPGAMLRRKSRSSRWAFGRSWRNGNFRNTSRSRRPAHDPPLGGQNGAE